MARSPFPTASFGQNVSEAVPGINVGAPAAGAAGDLASAARGFSRQVRKMAERAWTREGEADAARVIEAGNLTGNQPGIRDGQGVDDEAYNAVVRQNLLARRQAGYLAESDKVETANPDSVNRWSEGIGAVQAAFTPTGDPQIDIAFDRFRVLQDAQTLGRVRAGQERTRVETVRGAFVETATVGATALGQAIASAGFDDQGSALVGASLTQYAAQLAAYGPREAFTIGGVEFAADPSRAGVVSASALAQTFDEAQRNARTSWIGAAAERAPDAMSKRAFAGQVRERWAAGDPAFVGLDAVEMDRLTNRLDIIADRAGADEVAQVRAVEERVRSLLKAGEYGDDVDIFALRDLAAQTGDPALMAEVDFVSTHGFEMTPASLRASLTGGGGSGEAGFAGWVGPLMDELEGPGLVENDNGRGRAQFGITEASHPGAWRDGRVDRAEAQAIYKRDYWDPIGGDSLPPELAFAAASAAVVGGVGTAQDLLARAGGDTERFLQLEEQRFRRLAAEDPGKYGDDLPGWLNRIGKVRGQVGRIRAQRRAADGYASDPLGYARGTGTRPALATLAELDPNALFEGDPAQAADFLRSRRASGQELARRDGVPARILTSEEVAFIKDRITDDPAAIVTLVRRAGPAIGGEGTRELLGELSRAGVGGADLHLAQLSMEPENANVVASILEGRRLRAEGGIPPKWDEGEGIDDAMRGIASALAQSPDLTPAIRSLAYDRAFADQARGRLGNGGVYVNAALGATQRGEHRFGGVAQVNGAVTVVPSWMRADAFDDALEFVARARARQNTGPVYQNGQPIPAMQLARYRPRLMGNGNYRLINPSSGQPVAGRDGRAFEIDLDSPAFREVFTRTHPSLSLGAGR